MKQNLHAHVARRYNGNLLMVVKMGAENFASRAKKCLYKENRIASRPFLMDKKFEVKGSAFQGNPSLKFSFNAFTSEKGAFA